MKKNIIPEAILLGVLVLALFLTAAKALAFQATVAQQNSSGKNKNIEKINAIRANVFAWAETWENKDINKYMAYYSPNFRSGNINYRLWREKKSIVFQRPGAISVKILDLWVLVEGNTATVSFIQKYQDAKHADIGEKVLKFIQVGEHWRIISEQWKPLKG